MEKTSSRTACFCLLAAVILWGLQPVVIKILLESYTTMTIICIRSSLMVVGYLSAMKLTTGRFCVPRPADFLLIILLGLLGTPLENIPLFEGLRYTTAFNCALLGAAVPIITAVLARFLVKERLTSLQWLGIAISFAGVMYLLFKGDLALLMEFHFNSGDLLILLSKLSWALYIIYSRGAMRTMTPLQVAGWSNVIGVTMMIPYGVYTQDVHLSMPTWGAALLFLYVSLFAGVMAMILWNTGVQRLGPSRAASFSNITPIAGLFFANLILGEPFAFYQAVSFLTVAGGVYLLIHTAQHKSNSFSKSNSN